MEFPERFDPKVESWDALCKDWKLLQRLDGHRFSTDDLLVAWYASSYSPQVTRVLDLGSGVSTVASVVGWRCTGAQIVTVEAQAESVDRARRSAKANGWAERIDIRHGDFRDSGVLREDEKFNLVLGSPPYFPVGSGVLSPDPQKQACRFEVRGDLGDYARTAKKHLAKDGVFAWVFPIHPEPNMRRAFDLVRDQGFKVMRFRPVAFKEGAAPLLGVFLAVAAEDWLEGNPDPLWQDPVLTIRDHAGRVTPEYRAIKWSFGFAPQDR